MGRDGHIRLADFGLSKENMNEERLATTFCGSAEYISPEILAVAGDIHVLHDHDNHHGSGGYGYKHIHASGSTMPSGRMAQASGYDKSVDLWAFGCLIFELLTGLPPFYSGTCRSELYAKIRLGYVDFPPYLSQDAQDLVTRLLAKDPKARLGYHDANDVKSHPFFHGVDWAACYDRKCVPPIMIGSTQERSGMDDEECDSCVNFDDAFTSTPLHKEMLEEMATFSKQNTLEYQIFDNYNWASETSSTSLPPPAAASASASSASSLEPSLSSSSS